MKKVIGILGVAVVAVAMFLSANNVNSSTADSSLANLLTLNSANAECKQNQWIPEFNTGRCGLYGVCFPQLEYTGICDPYANNQG